MSTEQMWQRVLNSELTKSAPIPTFQPPTNPNIVLPIGINIEQCDFQLENFTQPLLPPTPPILKYEAFCYKTIREIPIFIHVYLPKYRGLACPIMLFIHGGGWVGGSHSEYCYPLFSQFLSLGFIVTSMDYRLLPEASLEEQLEDVRDVEIWLRNHLASYFTAWKVAGDDIIVVGASAGAHLALLTPWLWGKLPKAILSMYGPTDLDDIPFLAMKRFSKFQPPLPPTPKLLSAATTFDKPPTEIAPPTNAEGHNSPRQHMIRNVLQNGLLAEFLLHGLTDDNGELKLPEKGSLSRARIDKISPLQLVDDIDYPPVYQVIKNVDDMFDSQTHGVEFHEKLLRKGIQSCIAVVKGKGHAFDIHENIGDEIDWTVIVTAVNWVSSKIRDQIYFEG